MMMLLRKLKKTLDKRRLVWYNKDVSKKERERKDRRTMYVIKMMKDRAKGYVPMHVVSTPEEARALMRALTVYHQPIDIYYTYYHR